MGELSGIVGNGRLVAEGGPNGTYEVDYKFER
jgi:hypothetical protein